MKLFARNTMDPTDMSRLAGYCALMILLNHHYQGIWPEGDRDRERIIRYWLKKSRHRAPMPTLTRLGVIGDTVARRYYEQNAEQIAQLIDSKDTTLSEQLMEGCRKEMETEGLA